MRLGVFSAIPYKRDSTSHGCLNAMSFSFLQYPFRRLETVRWMPRVLRTSVSLSTVKCPIMSQKKLS